MPSSAAIFRKFALSLPGAFESAHMDHPDFRAPGPNGKPRIFATLSGEAEGRGVLKLTVDQQASFCEELPLVFTPCKGGWGRMGMTYVQLEAVEQDVLLGGLTTAHHNVAAKTDSATPTTNPAARNKPASAPVKAAARKSARKHAAAKPKIKL